MSIPVHSVPVRSLFLGLVLFLGAACSAPPARPLVVGSLDANPGETRNDPPQGEPGGDGPDTETGGMDPGGKMPESDPSDPPDSGGSDPTDPSDPPPAEEEPKYSLLFIGGGSDQIAVYKFNRSTGETALLKNHGINGAWATFLAVHPESRSVFAVDERGNQVLKMTVDPASGILSDDDKKPTASGPTHISVDPTGKAVFVANYGAGSVQSFGVSGRQLLLRSTKSPGRNAHAAHIDPSGKNLFVPCLGSGLIAQYSFSSDGSLTEAAPASISVGSKGPRHMAFHPNGNQAFLMNEYGGSIQSLTLSASKLSLMGEPVASTHAPVAGNTGAEIQVHPNGKFLYSSNRGDDSIAVYSIAANGSVTLLRTVKSGGRTPRHFALDPSGTWLTVANQGSDLVAIFAVDPATGGLTPKTSTINFKSAQYAEIFDFYE